MFLILLNFIFIVTSTYGARILGIVPAPACAHQVVFYPLWKELSLRGHQLTVLTTDPINDPKFTNLTEIDLSSSYKILRTFNIKEMTKGSLFKLLDTAVKLYSEIAEQQLQNSKVQDILNNETEHFDLVMVEFSFPAMAAFAQRFKCPFILMSPVDALSANYYSMGNPSHPILNPDFTMAFPKKLNFFHRLMSVASSFFVKYLANFRIISSQQPLVYKHFGYDYPDLEEFLSNASLFFVHTNSIIHPVRPLLPTIIQFDSGKHLMTSKPLPKDLQQRLDSDTNGFIYFSLGSNILNNLSEDTCQILLETFAELPCTVLWKFDQEDLPGKPDNVMISKWFPQQDIFRHSKIKLLVTQGSLQSIEEAIFNHIPIIGIPLVGDQPYNVKKVVENGMGLSIDFDGLDKPTLKETILEVMNNPKYRNNVKELAELAQDQPMTGLERAIWWTEYVIRHKGTKHLRSPALDIPFYQYFLLDVIGFCLLVVSIVVFIIVKITKMLCRFIKRFVIKSKVKTQ